MVSWGWIPLAFLFGVIVGVFLIGIVSLNDHQEEMEQKQKSRWYP